MALTKTPVCEFGKKAEDFKLKSIKNEYVSLDDIKGDKATLIMFICNHCPYVKAIIKDLVTDCNELKNSGVNTVAIMSNDTKNYPEDSFENMINFAKIHKFESINCSLSPGRPINLLIPMFLNAGSFISRNALCAILVVVLNISDGNDIKVPSGRRLNALTVSDTYA